MEGVRELVREVCGSERRGSGRKRCKSVVFLHIQ